jgi:hypothetical protein
MDGGDYDRVESIVLDGSSEDLDDLTEHVGHANQYANESKRLEDVNPIEQEWGMIDIESRSVNVLKLVVVLLGALVVTGTFWFLRQSEAQGFSDAVRSP